MRDRRFGRRSRTRLAASTLLVLASGASWSLAPTVARATPATASSASVLAPLPGLHIFSVNGRREGVTTTIQVMLFRPTRYRLEIGMAHRAVDGGLQTPSSMCRSTPRCVGAVNGDFFDPSSVRRRVIGDEVGAIVRHCVLLHTPEVSQQQADLTARAVSQNFSWTSTIYVEGVGVPVEAINQDRPIAYANIHLPLTGTLLYTSDYSPKVPSAHGRLTYEFAQLDRSTPATAINSTSELRLVARTVQPLKVKVHHVAVSASRGSVLAGLDVGDTVIMTTIAPPGCDSIGGHPVLIDHGVATSFNPADTYMARPYARTVVGWTAAGVTVLMCVDGVDGESGATAQQLVRLLRSLHVVTALDLDGGNSSTFYARGRILNHPSQGHERPVSTSLLVVQGQSRT